MAASTGVGAMAESLKELEWVGYSRSSLGVRDRTGRRNMGASDHYAAAGQAPLPLAAAAAGLIPFGAGILP